MNVNASLDTAQGSFSPHRAFRPLTLRCRTPLPLVARYSAPNVLLYHAHSAATNPSLLPSRRAEEADRADFPARAQAVAVAQVQEQEQAQDSAMTG
jgi:hypothetical protein